MAATIEDLSGTQIDQLLREAESRLASRTPQQTSVAKIQGQDDSKSIHAVANVLVRQDDNKAGDAQPAKKSDDLTVRAPQASLKKKDKAASKGDAGADWYNLPRTDLSDPTTKRNFQLLRMRSILANGKQHFKKDNRKDFIPEFSQMGTIIEGPTEYYSARLTRKERKRDLVEEVLSAEDLKNKFKMRYNKIEDRRASGKKGYYKKLMAQRRRGKK